MEKNLNFLDRNEFNYSPSKEVVEALKNFDINKLCFYTRIYDEGKKSILSVFLSELYDIDETQVLLGYGGEDILKQAVHYFLTQEDGNKTMLIPKFSWWYYKSIADEVNGHTLQYPLYEDGNTFKYDFETLKDMIQKEDPKILLLASPDDFIEKIMILANDRELLNSLKKMSLKKAQQFSIDNYCASLSSLLK